MKILDVVQGSGAWLQARSGIPTASEFHNLVTPLGAPKKGETPETYLATKLAERWLGGPLPTTYGGGAMEQGSLRESEAIPWYSLTYGRDVKAVGFVLTDDGRVGCSPDGMFEDGTGIEVKCPATHTHVKYLLNGELPADYTAQVQGSMFVTGAESWTFLSYSRQLPRLVLTVERDAAFVGVLGEALDKFCARLDAGYERLVALNGGKEPVREIVPIPATVPDDDQDFCF
ncbi:MAG: YqaJ viral recombinase family protein [Acidobacteria bacterium]|nr:YqaJ viral recombinase family protein [Acidobacteriota bacterium]